MAKRIYCLDPKEREKECTSHAYCYLGCIPCTGPHACVYCGVYEEEEGQAMSKYREQHYKDVAHVVARQPTAGYGFLRPAVLRFAESLADLFATDNPRVCDIHGEHDARWNYGAGCEMTGFDRAHFLKACGLEDA